MGEIETVLSFQEVELQGARVTGSYALIIQSKENRFSLRLFLRETWSEFSKDFIIQAKKKTVRGRKQVSSQRAEASVPLQLFPLVILKQFAQLT